MSRGLKQPWFHILLALAASPRHGSAIAAEVLEQSDGRVRLWPTTLYGSLDELEQRGLVLALEGVERPIGQSERRRFYRITELGRDALRDESAWYRSVSELASKRLRSTAKAAE